MRDEMVGLVIFFITVWDIGTWGHTDIRNRDMVWIEAVLVMGTGYACVDMDMIACSIVLFETKWLQVACMSRSIVQAMRREAFLCRNVELPLRSHEVSPQLVPPVALR